jgi:hypothetical protein
MLGRVEPFSKFAPATANTAASKMMSDQHSDWEQGWIIPHAEGAELLSQDDNRLVDSLLDRVPSKKERLSMLMLLSEILCWTANAEGVLAGPWRNH